MTFAFEDTVDSSKGNKLVVGGVKMIFSNQLKKRIVKEVDVVDFESLDGMSVTIRIEPQA